MVGVLGAVACDEWNVEDNFRGGINFGAGPFFAWAGICNTAWCSIMAFLKNKKIRLGHS